MNKIINILKQPNTSISEDIGDVELNDYTVFAGENNTGKTSLIRVLKNELEKQNHVIYIPAERVIVDAEIKTGAEKDPFRAALVDLIDVVLGDNFLVNSFVYDINTALSQEFSRYNVENHEVLLKTSNPSNDDYTKIIKETYIKNLIESINIKDSYSRKDNIKLSAVGQGTQRLIIASLLKYIGEKKQYKQDVSRTTYIIFEEPEIYLHPKLKESLNRNLLELSGVDIKIIISTHDPYFIQLLSDQKIYRVYRDPKKNYSTQLDDKVSKKYLNHKSYAEINFQVFKLPSETYFIELFEDTSCLLGYNGWNYNRFDEDMFTKYFQSKGVIKSCIADDEKTLIMPITRLRHDIAHGKDPSLYPITLQKGIEHMIEFKDYLASLEN